MKARLYRFTNGQYGVQVKRFGLFWIVLAEPDYIGNEICQTTGMQMIYQRGSIREAQRVVDNYNFAGPIK